MNKDAVVLVALVAFVVVASFSGSIGVDLTTGLDVIGRIAAVIGVAWAVISFGGKDFGDIFPLVVAGVAWAFFPALDYHAAKAMNVDVGGYAWGDMPWYATWYSKAAFVGVVPVVWYGMKWESR